MYDPDTVAFEIRSPFKRKSPAWPNGYRTPWFTIWHHDPERAGTGNRRDDSCGWFDRTPGDYADAVAYLTSDDTTTFEIERAIKRKVREPQQYGHEYPRLSQADTLALCLMVARELETRRWWNGRNGACANWWRRTLTRRRFVDGVAFDLALNPLDNLSTPDNPESVIHLIAAALNRRFRPWWRHPRWHVHHWRVQWHWWQAFKRCAFERCTGCGGRYRWGYSPTSTWGGDKTWHDECFPRPCASAPSPPDEGRLANTESSARVVEG